MTNDTMMTINLKRLNVLDVKLAITGLIHDMKRELNGADANDYRKKVVLPASIAKWERLRQEIAKQFEEQDIEEDAE